MSRVKEDSCENVYQTMDRENENDLDGLEVLEWENRRKQRMQENQYKLQEERQTYLYAIVALLIGFAMFITYRYRFTQRQSQLIFTQRQQLADRQRELIKANSDLEIALNHKAVFLSNMSHEIRTPLNAIVSMSNLATKEDMTTGARKYLRNIVIASSNLIDIVNDILDYSKLEAPCTSHVLDLVRCTAYFDDPLTLATCYTVLAAIADIVRVKNRFVDPGPFGYGAVR